MGNTKLRRYMSKNTKWTDKAAPKHKHIYSEQVIVEVRHGDSHNTLYNAMKCKHCNSFVCIRTEQNQRGLITGMDYDKTLPVLRLKTSHTWLIDFKDLELRD